MKTFFMTILLYDIHDREDSMSEDEIDWVDYDIEGNPTWVMKDGSRCKPPRGWAKEKWGFGLHNQDEISLKENPAHLRRLL